MLWYFIISQLTNTSLSDYSPSPFLLLHSFIPFLMICIIESFRKCICYVNDRTYDFLDTKYTRDFPLAILLLIYGVVQVLLMLILGYTFYLIVIAGLIIYVILRILRFCFRTKSKYNIEF